jgi:hypothetical protein
MADQTSMQGNSGPQAGTSASSNMPNSRPQEMKAIEHKKGAPMMAIGIVIVLIIAIAAAVLVFSGASKGSANSLYSQLSSRNVISVSELSTITGNLSGASKTQYEVGYSGTAVANVEGVQISIPLKVYAAKNGDQTRFELSVNNAPLIGNLSEVDISNGTLHYSCVKSSSSLLGSGSGSAPSYQCTNETGQISATSDPLLTMNFSDPAFNTSVIQIISVKESSYNGSSCTDLIGHISSNQSGGIASTLGEVGNVTLNTCISNKDGIPLTIWASTSASGESSPGSLQGSLNLTATSYGTVAPSNITSLPGPIESSGYGSVSSQPVTECIAEVGYLCSDPSYGGLDGNLSVIVGQSTGTNWISATFYYVNSTENNEVSSNPSTGFEGLNGTKISGTLNSGATQDISLPVSGSVSTGTTIDGDIYAQYQTEVGGQEYVVKIGFVSGSAS